MRNLFEEERIPTYRVQDEYDLLNSLPDSKPSKRMVKTKKGLKSIKALIDLEKNHNVSWYRYLKERSDKHPDLVALFYRGTDITYSQMMSRADDIAKYLNSVGVVAGDEVPICMTNTPELVYTLIAINKIGAKANVFGEQFNHDYIKQILAGCTPKVLFSDDSRFEHIMDAVDKMNIENVVVSSLSDSINHNYNKDSRLDKYYNYANKVPEYKEMYSNVKSFKEVAKIGEKIDKDVEYPGDLETDFLITYTSGSTIIGWPKAIQHSNRSLIVSGRFHDCELSGNPDMKDFSCLAHIPPESNTDLIACISDILLQGWKVCLEPEYGEDMALDYIMLNRPNYLNMTTSFFIKVAKDYLYEKRYNDKKVDSLFTTFAVGEKLSPGEEKLINTFLRKGRAGSSVPVNGFKFPFTTLGAAAGDCEHGAIFYTLWKKLASLKSKAFGINDCGLYPEAYVNATVLKLNADGVYEECDYGEMGLVVANSYSTMKGYKNNPEATKKLLVTDNLGRTWLSCNTLGYMDKLGGVHIKGRRELLYFQKDGKNIPLYKIEEMISKDTKKILSCQVVENDGTIEVVIQPQYGINEYDAMTSVKKHLSKEFDNSVIQLMNFTCLPFDESFPLTHSGKRELTLNTLLQRKKVQKILSK